MSSKLGQTSRPVFPYKPLSFNWTATNHRKAVGEFYAPSEEIPASMSMAARTTSHHKVETATGLVDTPAPLTHIALSDTISFTYNQCVCICRVTITMMSAQCVETVGS